MKAPRLVDTTLRDGSHPMRHQFQRSQVRAIVTALDGAGVPVIEVSHGDGLGGSSIQYGFSHTDEMDLIEEARAAAARSKIAALLLPGVGTRKDLKWSGSQPSARKRMSPRSTSRWPRRWTWRPQDFS